jgi:hypothetical protein
MYIDLYGLQQFRYPQPMLKLLPDVTAPSLERPAQDLGSFVKGIANLYDNYSTLESYCEIPMCPVPKAEYPNACPAPNIDGTIMQMSSGPFFSFPGEGMTGCKCLKAGTRIS